MFVSLFQLIFLPNKILCSSDNDFAWKFYTIEGRVDGNALDIVLDIGILKRCKGEFAHFLTISSFQTLHSH